MALKPEHKIFIRWLIKTGDHIASYQKAFPQSDRKTAATNGRKLLKNTEIASAVRDGSAKISQKAENQAADELKNEIKADVLTALQKRELLRQIANGEWINGKQPGFMDRLKAIEIDNKMVGDNAPDKKDLTSGGKPLPSLPLIQKIEIVHTEWKDDSSADEEEGDGDEADE